MQPGCPGRLWEDTWWPRLFDDTSCGWKMGSSKKGLRVLLKAKNHNTSIIYMELQSLLLDALQNLPRVSNIGRRP